MKRYKINWVMVNAYILAIIFLTNIFIICGHNKSYNEKIRQMEKQIIEIKNEVSLTDANPEMKLH